MPEQKNEAINGITHYARPTTNKPLEGTLKNGGLPGFVTKHVSPQKGAGGNMNESPKVLLSLFDYSGSWAKPFADAGWIVHQWDIKLSEFMDINLIKDADIALELFEHVNGIIAAPPCTDFASSGAHVWKFKDEDGRTHKSIELVQQVQRLVNLFAPTDPDYDEVWFWAIENPVGRMGKLTGMENPWYFNPFQFSGWLNPSKKEIETLNAIREKSLVEKITKKEGDFVMSMEAYSKKTGLWGDFAKPATNPLEPVFITSTTGKRFSPVAWFTGGKSDKTKEERSNTPYGFAMAFYEANKNYRAQFQAGYWVKQGWSEKEEEKFIKHHAHLLQDGGSLLPFNRPIDFKLIDKAPLPIPSASSIECLLGDTLYVVGDDSPHLFISDVNLRNQKLVRLFTGEGRIPKFEKHDLEAACIMKLGSEDHIIDTPIGNFIYDRGAEKYHLVMVSSASLPGREIVIDALVDDIENFKKYDASVFFSRLRQFIPNLNIEGMTALAGLGIVMASRGNRSNPQNYLIHIPDRQFYKNQEITEFFIHKLNLPSPDMGVSGLCYLPHRQILLLTISSENSPSAIEDGEIGDSYFGWISNFYSKLMAANDSGINVDLLTNLTESDSRFKNEKIESVCVETEIGDQRYIVHFVSDNDNGTSNIFKAAVNLPPYRESGGPAAPPHLAPNGKPSNLTPEQYHLVRTPAFKAWFGDWERDPKNSSKGLDENGEPLVFYHGTNRIFSDFDFSKNRDVRNNNFQGNGFFFTDNEDDAWRYANAAVNQAILRDEWLKSLGKYYPEPIAFLQKSIVEHGYTPGYALFHKKYGEEKTWEIVDQWEEATGLDINRLNDFNQFVEGSNYDAENETDNSLAEIMGIFSNSVTSLPSYIVEQAKEYHFENALPTMRVIPCFLNMRKLLKTSNPERAKKALQNGYDSVLYNGSETIGDAEYIVYRPEQIKIAESKSNANVEFAIGGQLHLFEEIRPATEAEIEAVPDDKFRATPQQVEELRLENPNPQLTLFSFGGGQDSWCMLYKFIYDKEFRKKYAPNDLVIAMSDTGNEFPYTYKYLQQAIELGKQNGIHFQFITSDQGFHTEGWPNLKHNIKKNDNILSATMQRQPCTINLKINVVDKYMHHYMMQKYFGVDAKNKNGWKLYREKFGTKARVIIGFAKDEEARVIKSHRMHMAKDSTGKPLLPKWKMENIQYCYPLIEEGWNRAAAQDIILQYRDDLPPPSNCMICFYQSDQEIIWLERNYPDEFYEWVELEKRKLKKFAHKEKNYGVYGTINLLQKLEQAKKKYGHWTDEQLWEYKMSHGHCVKSAY